MFDILTLVPPAELAAFLAAGVILNLTPGADVMFATASGLQGGARVGAVAGLGVGLGGLFHVSLAVLGVKPLPYGIEDAIQSMRILDAVFESEKTGTWAAV